MHHKKTDEKLGSDGENNINYKSRSSLVIAIVTVNACDTDFKPLEADDH
jgi:hypothetical protein